MALIVEDGSQVAGAEAYASVADADAYFTARANTTWAALGTSAKEAALRLAADYIEAMYGERWQGERVTWTQALSWPRQGVVLDGVQLDYDVIPGALMRANVELALKASAGELLADQGAQVVSETVGPISVTYAAGARQATRYAYVENMLAALLDAGLNQVAVRRA
jgi:hypothetical protein